MDGKSGLREVGTGGHASWSPDGSRIAMSDPEAFPDWGYYTVAADGSDRRELVAFRAGGPIESDRR